MKNKIRKVTLRVLSTVLAVFMLIGAYTVGLSAATYDEVILNDKTRKVTFLILFFIPILLRIII